MGGRSYSGHSLPGTRSGESQLLPELSNIRSHVSLPAGQPQLLSHQPLRRVSDQSSVLPHVSELLSNFTILLSYISKLLPHVTKLFTNKSQLLSYQSELLAHISELLSDFSKLFTHQPQLLPHQSQLFSHQSELLADFTLVFTNEPKLLADVA